MRLSGQHLRKLQEALIDAFPTKAVLEQLLLLELERSLDQIAGGSNLQEVVFNLITTANAQGWLVDLIKAARKENPRNSHLEVIERELLPSNSGVIPPDQPDSNDSSITSQFQNLVQLWIIRTRQPIIYILLTITASISFIIAVIIPILIAPPKYIKDVDVPEGEFQYTATTSWSSIRCNSNWTGIDRQVQFHSKNNAFQPVYTPPNANDPTIKGVSSLEAIKSLINSEDVAFAVSSRPLDEDQKAAAKKRGFALEEHAVARDVTTIAVNYNLVLTKIGGLPLRSLKTIYTSKQSRSWGEFTGSPLSPDIAIVPFIHKAETVREYPFQINVLKHQPFGSVKPVDDTHKGITNVKNNPGGIYLAPAALIYIYYHQTQRSVQPMPVVGTKGNPVLPFEKSFNPQDVCDPNKQNNSLMQVNPEYPKELQQEIVYVIVKRYDTNATTVQKEQEKAGLAYVQVLKTDEGRKLLARMGFQPSCSFWECFTSN